MTEVVYQVSDFVAVFNQTLEFAYPSVTIAGELANFRISKNKWVYFDLKDELSSVKFFGTVYQLPGPLEEGMLLQVRAVPRLHPQFGFSLTVQSMQPVGEGSIKRAAALLEAKLTAEGLFDPARKRMLPYPPSRIGLITSAESAAYADFIKVLGQRWGGVDIQLIDVQVQGELAVPQIVAAVAQFNQVAHAPDVLVLIRGGGSADDLAAFSTEQVTRAVSASRIPTLVAIGHEVDLSLAELAADQRASTPSNAAELLVPSRRDELKRLESVHLQLSQALTRMHSQQLTQLHNWSLAAQNALQNVLDQNRKKLTAQQKLLKALSPQAVLQRGYAIIRLNAKVVRSGKTVKVGQKLTAQLADATVGLSVDQIELKSEVQ